MNIRVFNQKYLEPGAMWLMILGIVFLCQPWIAILHHYSVTIMLIGIIAFNVAVHIPPPVRKADDDTGPAAMTEAASRGTGHG